MQTDSRVWQGLSAESLYRGLNDIVELGHSAVARLYMGWLRNVKAGGNPTDVVVGTMLFLELCEFFHWKIPEGVLWSDVEVEAFGMKVHVANVGDNIFFTPE